MNDADINFYFDPPRQATRAGHAAGLRLLRVAARARAEHGGQAVGPLYEAIGTQAFDSDTAPGLGLEELGSREFIEPLPERAGLPATSSPSPGSGDAADAAGGHRASGAGVQDGREGLDAVD